jgi:flagellar basal body-associated protein FliL
MPLVLTDDAKVAIELYIKQLNEKNEEQRQKRIALYSTIIGIFTAAFTGVIVGLLAWALNSIITGTHDAAVEAAKQETVRVLQLTLQTINTTTERANDAALKATQSAVEARVE